MEAPLFIITIIGIIFPFLFVDAHNYHAQDPRTPRTVQELEHEWGFELGYSGISTFANLRHVKCLTHPEELFDIAIVGAPFDTAVTYRPGARFAPRAIRDASSRQSPHRGHNPRAALNPYTSWATILDCGDLPITPFDNSLALQQMTSAFLELGSRQTAYSSPSGDGDDSGGDKGKRRRGERRRRMTKLVTLGGDHSVALPALRALRRIYEGPVAVLHFDAHLDTWRPTLYPETWRSETSAFTHGSMFWMASNEGLILNGSSVHAGLRTRLSGDGVMDLADDDRQGWMRISSDDIDDVGVKGVVEGILRRIGVVTPVYLSVDIDVIDPGMAPGTGTPEPGGWTTRELIRILRGIEDLNIVGADVVEVSPPYDDRGGVTALAASQLVYEIITSMVKREFMDRDFGHAGGDKDEL